MIACPHCPTDAREYYVPHCSKCVIRRIARLGTRGRSAVINSLRTGRETFRQQVEAERARLESVGRL